MAPTETLENDRPAAGSEIPSAKVRRAIAVIRAHIEHDPPMGLDSERLEINVFSAYDDLLGGGSIAECRKGALALRDSLLGAAEVMLQKKQDKTALQFLKVSLKLRKMIEILDGGKEEAFSELSFFRRERV